MLPCRTNQDCIAEPKQQHKSELLAVSASLNFHWFSVSEVERGREGDAEPGEAGEGEIDDSEGGGKAVLMIECLAVLKKKDLGAELRQLDCCEFVSSNRLWPVLHLHFIFRSQFNKLLLYCNRIACILCNRSIRYS